MPDEPFVERCQRAMQAAAELGAKHLIASDPSTVRWLTGRTQALEYGPPYPFSAGTLVLLHQNGGGAIICPEDDEMGGPPISRFEVQVYTGYTLDPLDPFRNAARLLRTDGLVAVEAHACSAILVGDRRWVDATPSLRALRVMKDQAELQILRRAAKVASAGQRAFRELVRPGMTEVGVFSQVHAAMEKAAGERVPVLVDLMSGERVLEVGRPPTNRVLGTDELVLCDLLARVDGYWADSCTTLSTGTVDDPARRLHEVCQHALALGIDAAKPGVTAGELDQIVRADLASAGYAYPHHSGHGLGVSFHEEPRIVPSSELVLKAGMVLALEPAGFTDRIGARVEHTLEITDSGACILTDHDLSLN